MDDRDVSDSSYLRRVSAVGLAGVLVFGMVGCDRGYRLDLEVFNESDEPALMEILRVDDHGATIGTVSTDTVPLGDRGTVNVGRPDRWEVHVNGTAVTESGEWPHDNPTIDLSVLIQPGGQMEVIDDWPPTSTSFVHSTSLGWAVGYQI